MNISIDKLKYFLEVANLEHVGLASKSLGISASAISSAIAAIEAEYGCILFERSHQRIHLNEKGQWLREQVKPIIDQLESLPQQINGKELQFRGHVNVGGSYFLANHFLQPILHETQMQNSELSIEISPLRTTQVSQEVLSGLLDYGICFSPSGHPDLEKQILYHGNLQIVVSKKHPLVKQVRNKTFKIKALNDYPASIHKYTPGIDYRETHAFDKIGVQPDIRNFYHSEELAIKTVLESDFWAVVPDLVADYYKSELFIIPLPKEWNATFEICSIYRKTMKGRGIFLHLDQKLLEKL